MPEDSVDYGTSDSSESDEPCTVKMSAIEENALRYACGFVPFKLLKRFKVQNFLNACPIWQCKELEESRAIMTTQQNGTDCRM